MLIQILEFDRTLVGRKLIVNQNALTGRYNQKVNLRPNNIAQILISNREDWLSKHSTRIEKIFKKGNIRYLGNCYLTVTAYHINTMDRTGALTCLKLEIMPFNSKTKLYKFLLNSKDLEFYWGLEYSNNSLEENLKLLDALIRKLQLKRQKIYSAIQLPISHHFSFPNPNRSYSLCNDLKARVHQITNQDTVTYGRFLEPRIRSSRVIIQKVKKIRGQYLIITITNNSVLDYWAITVYNPRSSRKFVTLLYFSDLLNMQPLFLNKMYPQSLKLMAKKRPTANDYSSFCVLYNQHSKEKSKKRVTRLTTAPEIIEMQFSEGKRDMTQEFLESINFLSNPRKVKSMTKEDEEDHFTDKCDFIEMKVSFLWCFFEI